MRRLFVAGLLAAGVAGGAADNGPQLSLRGAQEIAKSGRYEIALRSIELALATYPEDPQLIAMRSQLVEAVARSSGNLAPPPPATTQLPVIANRRPEPGRDFTTETAGIAMIWIAPGAFLMCNPQGSDDDTLVTLSEGYWLGRTEVTQEQLQTVMEHLPPQNMFPGSDRPAERISWLNAMEFGRLITERERAVGRLPPGYEYTLPTEAQWEYACRAGTTGPHAGELATMAWFAANSDRQTHPVGQKQPNAWDLYDMHGNVAEWCADGYDGYPGGRVTDMMNGYDGPSAAMARIYRGGGWTATAGQCRSDVRYWGLLTAATPHLGFRLALAPIRNVSLPQRSASN